MRKHKVNTYRCVSPEACGLHVPKMNATQDKNHTYLKDYEISVCFVFVT